MTSYSNYMEVGLYREASEICEGTEVEDEHFEGVDGTAVDVHQPFGRAVINYTHVGTSVIEIDDAQDYSGDSSLLCYNDATNIPIVTIGVDLPNDFQRLEFWVRAADTNSYLELDLMDGAVYCCALRLMDTVNEFSIYYGDGGGGSNTVSVAAAVDDWYKIWMDVKPSVDKWRCWIDETLYEGPGADAAGWDNYYNDGVGPAPDRLKIWMRKIGDGVKSAWVDAMTLYDGPHVVDVSLPVAVNCHPLLRNKPLGLGYNLGVEDIEITYGPHTGDHIASEITSISDIGKTITLSGGDWIGEIVTVRYYAAGNSPSVWRSSIRAEDHVRAEHPDNILTAYNRKGHVNPLEAGMVFDNAMARTTMGLSDAAENTALEYDISDGSSTGSWSFSGNRPYYVTAVRIEVEESETTTTKGFTVHLYEDGTEVGEQGGVAGIYISDADNWLTSEYVDGVDTWYSTNIYLGMMLCSDFKVTLEKDVLAAAIAADAINVFVMGWYVPDSTVATGVTESFTYHAVPAPCGLYTEKVYTVSSNIGVSTEPRYLPDMDASLRTVPHARNEYRYGIEYAKNLTTDEFITSAIKEVADTIIYFDPTAATSGDKVELGYYSYDTLGAVSGLTPKAGDIIRSTDVDGLFRALDRCDRVDFGKDDFSYGNTNHEYVWHPEMFAKYSLWGDHFGPSAKVSSGWQNLMSFDPYNYNSRNLTKRHSDYLDRATSGVDETPFFVTGFQFSCDQNAVTGGKKYANGIKFKISFHSGSDSVRQLNQSEIIYYPLSSTAGIGLGEPVPAAIGGERIAVLNSVDGPIFFVPLGMIRCYSFSIDVAVDGGEAFTEFNQKFVQLQGWMIEAS